VSSSCPVLNKLNCYYNYWGYVWLNFFKSKTFWDNLSTTSQPHLSKSFAIQNFLSYLSCHAVWESDKIVKKKTVWLSGSYLSMHPFQASNVYKFCTLKCNSWTWTINRQNALFAHKIGPRHALRLQLHTKNVQLHTKNVAHCCNTKVT